MMIIPKLTVLVLFSIFWCSLQASCPNDCYSSYQHGFCQPDSTCSCTIFWTGDDCSISNSTHDWDNMDCYNGGIYSPSYFTAGLNRACDCTSEWGGIDCALCLSNSSCIDAHANNTYRCDSSFVMYEDRQFQCTTNDGGLSSLLNGGPLTATWTIPDNELGTGHYEAWGSPTGSPLVIACTTTNCTKQNDGKTLSINCLHTKCHCTTWCSFFVSAIAASASTTTSFICDIASSVCTFNQNEISLLRNAKVTCNTTECVSDYQPPLIIPAPPPPKNIGLAVGLAVGLGAFVLIILSCFLLHRYQRYKLLPDTLTSYQMRLDFENISCSVPTGGFWLNKRRKVVLESVSGYCKPGQLLGILGPSGSGKTTLLDLLAGRKARSRDSWGGSILINRKPKDSSFNRATGYVRQDDVLHGTLTVMEHLMVIARLRLPENMPFNQKQEKVETVINKLGLDHIKDTKIGSLLNRGISGGEKKRVAIAAELLSDPSILFLDEPTSGLDSYNAYMIIKTLSALAKECNCAVVFSIHQPRNAIYQLLDRVIVLSRGYTFFSGDKDELPKRLAQCELLPGADDGNGNEFVPVDIPELVLDIVASRDVNETQKLCAQMRGQTETSSSPRNNMESFDLDDNKLDGPMSAYSTTFFTQLQVLIRRSLLHIYRDPQLLRVQYASYIIIGALLGWVFYKLPHDENSGGVQNRLGSLFFISTLLCFGALTSVELFFSERVLYVRERANGYYRPSAYFFSKLLCELIIMKVIPTILLGCICYYMIGFRPEASRFFYFLFIIVLISICSTTMCLAISSIVPNVAVGNLLAILLMFLFLLFNGFLVNIRSAPKSLSWIAHLSYLAYGYTSLLINELDGLSILFNPSGFASLEIDGSVFLDELAVDTSMYYNNIYILLAWAVWYTGLSYLFVRFVKER